MICIILNSTSLVKKAIPFISIYSRVISYLDNDEAGINAVKVIEQSKEESVLSMSHHSFRYKDLNEFLSDAYLVHNSLPMLLVWA